MVKHFMFVIAFKASEGGINKMVLKRNIKSMTTKYNKKIGNNAEYPKKVCHHLASAGLYILKLPFRIQ